MRQLFWVSRNSYVCIQFEPVCTLSHYTLLLPLKNNEVILKKKNMASLFECMSLRTREFNGWFFLHYIHAYMDWFVLISIKTAVKIDVHFLWVAVSHLSFKDRSTEINQSSFALGFNFKTLGLQWGGLNCFCIRKTHTRPKDGCISHLKSLHNAEVP